MLKLLILSYVLLAIGITVVTIDLRSQGLTTIAALKTHLHTFRIFTVIGASAATLGVMLATTVVAGGLVVNPLMAVAALPACIAFFFAAKAINVA